MFHLTWWELALTPLAAALGGLLGFIVVQSCITLYELWESRRW